MFKNLNPSALGVSGHQSEIIELALTYGFAGIDLNMAEFATRVRLKGMPYARRLIQSAKIRIGTFPLPLEWDTDDETFQKDLKKLPEYADCAAELGCTRCTAMLAPAGDSSALSRELRVPPPPLPRHLRGVEAGGRPPGRRLSGRRIPPPQPGLPVHPRPRRPDVAVEHGGGAEPGPVAGHLGRGGLRRVGGDASASCRAKQIVAVQVADMPADVPLAELDEKSRLLPGGENGRIDVAGFLAALREMGYDGPVTVKPSRSAFQSRRRDVIVKQTGEALDKVWRAAGLPPPPGPSLAAARD